ncbi:MAG: hypothetical protein JNN15_19170 [Blastocatellia bacterium]|nr:hypothetical protein [Blastocatellia bacterium]
MRREVVSQNPTPSLFLGVEPKKRQQPTKKERLLQLYNAGQRDIFVLAEKVKTQPSYVASVLQSEGLISGYCDLYTTTDQDQNAYSKFFRNVLSFKTPEDARSSVEKIDILYRYFECIGDRAGQHHAQVVALTGRNRARWSGKYVEAKIFAEWLMKN